MNKKLVRSAVATLALSGVLAGVASVPAMADTTSTKNIIYGAAAAAAAFTLYNVEHKHQLASTVSGRLANGATVYADGHVVGRNGQVWYPGNNGQTVACNNGYCTMNGNANGNYGYGYNNGYGNNNGYGYNNNYGYSNNTRRSDNGNHYGWQNGNGNRNRDRDRDGGRGH
ncbi:MAG TPA: hypothetical protein VFL13_15730 [Candidatus Baltobacteraceae bacterium]|nr:hypothetical protein [Candidatus Baltobacteraceae bacterium]